MSENIGHFFYKHFPHTSRFLSSAYKTYQKGVGLQEKHNGGNKAIFIIKGDQYFLFNMWVVFLCTSHGNFTGKREF